MRTDFADQVSVFLGQAEAAGAGQPRGRIFAGQLVPFDAPGVDRVSLSR